MTKILRHGLIAAAVAFGSLASPAAAPAAAQATPPATPPAATPPAGTTTNSTLPAGSALSLDVPAQLKWRPGDRIPLTVASKVAEAPGLSVVAGPFVDSGSGEILQSSFCLANDATADCEPIPTLSANGVRQLWMVGSGDTKPGAYAGTVRIVASNGLQASQSITLNVTSDDWRLLGLAALVAGVILSFVMSVYVPHQRARDLALTPFADMQQRLQAAGDQVKPDERNVRGQIGRLAGDLSARTLRLRHIIPPRWPAATEAPADADVVKAYADGVLKRLEAIELLAATLARTDDPTVRTNLDAIANDPNFPPADIKDQINRALGITPVRGARGAANVNAEFTPAKLIMREEVRNILYWLVSSILAVALGYVLLIDGDPAFGGWKDVTSALLWGLGVAAAGTKLADLTVGQVRTAVAG